MKEVFSESLQLILDKLIIENAKGQQIFETKKPKQTEEETDDTLKQQVSEQVYQPYCLGFYDQNGKMW